MSNSSLAERISRSSSFIINAKVRDAFPLFGPIREMDWAYGWNPQVIYGNSEVALHMIFVTPSPFPEEDRFTWAITTFNPEQFLIEYTVSTINRIWFIRVSCIPMDSKTEVCVTYTYTALSPLGKKLNETALENMFAQDLKDWQDAINHFLQTGSMLLPETHSAYEK